MGGAGRAVEPCRSGRARDLVWHGVPHAAALPAMGRAHSTLTVPSNADRANPCVGAAAFCGAPTAARTAHRSGAWRLRDRFAPDDYGVIDDGAAAGV